MRHTKIVCTLGPASLHEETVAAMVRAGMDVARLNTSHGTLEGHVEALAMVRRVARAEGRPIAVLMDLGGPKLRTGPTEGGRPIQLEAAGRIRLTSEPVTGNAGVVSVAYPRLTEDVRPGERVLLDDGRIELEVLAVSRGGLDCRVVYGGLLGPGKGVAFPASTLTMPALTARDREAVQAGVAAGVDFFALSFVREPEDLAGCKALIASLGASIPVIAKIERRQAVENLEAVLAEADGAMVARGDLGVELPPEDVPVAQRRIIAAAADRMIPVITATQMLESMVDSPRPTRAESSDVANAAWDYSDALMLSQETAIGRYPVEAVAMMDRIIRSAEAGDTFLAPRPQRGPGSADDHSFVIAVAARDIVESDPNMRGVVCFTRSGYTAFLLSKVHPRQPIYAATPDEAVWRRLSLARSVLPLKAPVVASSEEMLATVDSLVLDGRHLAVGEEVVVVASLPVKATSSTNFLKLHRLGEARLD
jgi:pyruvate kinase